VSFAEQIGEWHEFYTTVAGLSATLVGLLFVSLGLNPGIVSKQGPAGIRVLAAQTFHNFVIVLVIALVALIPDDTAHALTITLLIVGVQGIIRVAFDLRRARRDPDPHWSAVQALARYVSPALAYLICLGVAWDLRDSISDALGWLVAVIFLLLMSATANCWDLLEAIGSRDSTS
jgi:Na+/melibiose symporter-like transporter